MNDWLDALQETRHTGEACVLLTVCGVRGSAPREVGARMLVTEEETIGTIGGGQLEYACTKLAAENLRAPGERKSSFVRRYPLGPDCGQCCGGVVDVMFERIAVGSDHWPTVLREARDARQPCVIVNSLADGHTCAIMTEDACLWPRDADQWQALHVRSADLLASDQESFLSDGYLFQAITQSNLQVAVFGAGHVGTAIVDALARLDTEVRWIDSRRNVLPDCLPASVTALSSATPALEVAAMPSDAYYLVMTHSHPLDLEICSRVLQRNDVAYCGLIGSQSKRRRFERLLLKQGISDMTLQNLTCPIGIDGIDSKQPADIALAVVAEVVQVRDARRRAQATHEDTRSGVANLHRI